MNFSIVGSDFWMLKPSASPGDFDARLEVFSKQIANPAMSDDGLTPGPMYQEELDEVRRRLGAWEVGKVDLGGCSQ